MMNRPLILIVDDEEAIVSGLTHRLERSGYRAVGAYTSAEAVEIAVETTPDLVLLDQCLPERNGSDVLQELKCIPATRHIPVVLLSGAEVSHQDAIAAGAAAFLRKPYRRDELLELVESLLAQPESISDGQSWRRRLF